MTPLSSWTISRQLPNTRNKRSKKSQKRRRRKRAKRTTTKMRRKRRRRRQRSKGKKRLSKSRDESEVNVISRIPSFRHIYTNPITIYKPNNKNITS
jgi:hypothetical protein